MSVILETSLLSIGWLKDRAPRNIELVLVTFDISQISNGLLKEEASRNTEAKTVAFRISHSLIS